MKKRQSRNSRKIWQTISTIAMVVVVLGGLLLFNAYAERIQHDAELDGQKIEVEWSILNFRKEAGLDGDIICELYSENTVELTGNFREWGVGEPDLESLWYECTVTTTDGAKITGWVTSKGLNWEK